jgi:hypothetical protein
MQMDELFPPSDDKKIRNGLITFSACMCILFGIAVLVFFVKAVSDSHSIPTTGEPLNLISFGAFGNFIAGVVGIFFALGGFLLLFLTLKDQRDNFHRARIDGAFFEMIKFHRDNVSELQYTYHETKEEKVTVEKREVFSTVFLQFKEAWEELNFIFKNTKPENIYEKEYLIKIKSNITIEERKIDLKEFAQIDIIYSIVFFGLNKEDKQTILDSSAERYKSAFINKVLDFASLKPKRESDYWETWETIGKTGNQHEVFNNTLNKRAGQSSEPTPGASWIDNSENPSEFQAYYPDDYQKYYGGHQFRLDHYYRHMYQTIEFIDNEKSLTNSEKYNYIKILRGQLSDYEQIVFFLNSLSETGRAWELMKKNKADEEIKKDKQLITKYNLIKNIPMQHITSDINIVDYYPNVNYESIIIATTPEEEIKEPKGIILPD